MATVSEIESKILTLEGGAYQNLMNGYLYAKYNLDNLIPLGSEAGTNKTTKGIPDAYVRQKDGTYIYIMYGTVKKSNVFKKLKTDIESVKNGKNSIVPLKKISKLICCHTSHNLSPTQTDQLHALFPRLELIDIATMSQEIYLRYQYLAASHLGLHIDTNQILPYERFIQQYDTRASASLSFKLCGRDKEQKDLKELLLDHDVLVVHGKSGRGKTRLALEVGKDFSAQKQYIFKTVLNNEQDIYEDIRSHFPDDSNYLIFIDDANFFSSIQHFLDLARDTQRRYKIKLILTVRDYAVADLQEKIMQEKLKICSYELQPLNEKVIQKIITDNFRLTNLMLLDRITHITHDNIRLAIMAAQCAGDKEWEKIQNPFDIFDLYYKKTFSNFSLQELQIAALIAFFQKFKLSPNHIITIFLSKLNIDYDHFLQIIRQLRDKEIVDMLEDLAIKFGEQTLGDYLLYRFFIKEPILPFSEVLERTLPQYLKNVTYIVDVAHNIFNQPNSNKKITQNLKFYWHSISSHPFEEKLNFLESFFWLLPTETLVFISRTLQSLPNVHSEKTPTIASTDVDRMLHILVSYKYLDSFEDALDILCSYIQNKTNNVSRIYSILEETLFIGPYSNLHAYKQELTIIKALRKRFQQTNNTNIGTLLILFANTCLKTENTNYHYTSDTVNILKIKLTFCKSSLQLRKQAISSLKRAFKIPALQAHVRKILFQFLSNRPQKFFKTDMANLLSFALHCLSHRRFDDSLLLYSLYHTCKKYRIPYLRYFNTFKKNLSCPIFVTMGRSEREDCSSFEESYKQKVQQLKYLTKDFSRKDFQKFFQDLTLSQLIIDTDPYYSHYGLQALFEAQSFNPNAFSKIFLAYGEVPCDLLTPSLDYILENAIKVSEPQILSQLITQISEPQQLVFRSAFYNALPAEQINTQDTQNLLDLLKGKKENKKIFLLPLSKILQINKHHPNFAYTYIKEAYNLFINTPVLLTNIFRDYTPNDTREAKSIVKVCSPSTDHKTLQNIYILLATHHRHSCFDYHASLFQAIYELDNSFIENIIKQALQKKGQKDTVLAIFQQIWNLPEATHVIHFAIDTIYQIASSEEEIISSLSHILFPVSERTYHEQRKKFVRMYIKQYASNLPKMRHLFRAMWSENFDNKQRFIVDFCQQNHSFQDFRSIQCRNEIFSWSGSQIPVIESRIRTLQQSIKTLKGSPFLEHRNYMEQQIVALEQRKRQIVLDEFLGDPLIS